MKKMCNFLRYLLVFFCVFYAAVQAAPPKPVEWVMRDSDSRLEIRTTSLVELKAPQEMLPIYGFYPVEVDIRNLLPQDRTITFTLPASSMSIEVKVPARGIIKKVIYFPLQGGSLTGYRDYEMSGAIAASEPGFGLLGNGTYINGGYGENVAAAGSEKFLHRDALSTIRSDMAFTTLDYSQLPVDWRVYSMLDVMVMNHDEFNQLDTARKTVLKEWVFNGGTLLLNNYDPAKALGTALEPLGRGIIKDIKVNTGDKAAMTKFYKDISNKGAYKRRTWYVDPVLDPRPSDFQLSLPPLTALFILAFVILVGPINLWVLAPVGKRHKLFYTTPVITFASGVVLFIFILIVDGFGGKGMRITYIDLFPEGNSAFVTQSQVSTSGILNKTGFDLSGDVLLNGKNLDQRGQWEKMKGIRNENFATGYFASRSAVWQSLSARMLTRAAVTQVETSNDGSPVILSSLPTVLNEFIYTDSDNKQWYAEVVNPGQKVTLSLGVPSVGGGAAKKKVSVPPMSAGSYEAKGRSGELGPIETLSSISWEDQVIYRGLIVKK